MVKHSHNAKKVNGSSISSLNKEDKPIDLSDLNIIVQKSKEQQVQNNSPQQQFTAQQEQASQNNLTAQVEKPSPAGDKLLFDDPKDEIKYDHAGKSSSSGSKSNAKKDDEKLDFDQDEDGYVRIEGNMTNDDSKKSKEYIHIKVPKPSILMLERIVYWIVIIVLLVLLLNAPAKHLLSNLFPGLPADESNNNATLAGTDDSIKQSPSIANNTNTVTQNNSVTQNKTNTNLPLNNTLVSGANNNSNSNTASCPKGSVKVEFDDISMNGTSASSIGSRTILSFTITITNNNNSDLKDYYINFNSYNRDTKTDLGEYPRLKASPPSKFYKSDVVIPKCGGKKTLTFNSDIKLRMVSTRELVNTFDIQLLNSNEFDIASATDSISAI